MMVVKVIFHSMTGNTRKVAEAIASEVGVRAEEVATGTLNDNIDVLFLGDGNYGSNIHAKTKQFIAGLDPHKVKNVAIFGTYGGVNNAAPKMKALLETKGLHIVNDGFTCKGKAWLFMNRKSPTEADIAAAKAFARQVIEQCQ
jgi:flavodoxin